jgi:RNA polymerase sigma-70 factor (ECF subfamily)
MPDVSKEDIPQSLVAMKDEQQKYFIDLALQKIHSKEALALNLFYLQEYSVEEVSDLTGWSVSNVKVFLFRARKRMYCELSKILKTEKKLLY